MRQQVKCHTGRAGGWAGSTLGNVTMSMDSTVLKVVPLKLLETGEAPPCGYLDTL